MKTCTLCNESKEETRFFVRKASKDSLSPRCKPCDTAAKKQWRIDNKARYQKSNKDYHEVNKESNNLRTAEWRKSNREKFLQSMKNWRDKNKARQGQHGMAYNAGKLNATPSWLTEKQRNEMVDVYKERVELNELHGSNSYHVDHIVPLQGKNVCGLHVPWNLQILSKSENISKGNRDYPDSWPPFSKTGYAGAVYYNEVTTLIEEIEV